jgi:hypothetical protein
MKVSSTRIFHNNRKMVVGNIGLQQSQVLASQDAAGRGGGFPSSEQTSIEAVPTIFSHPLYLVALSHLNLCPDLHAFWMHIFKSTPCWVDIKDLEGNRMGVVEFELWNSNHTQQGWRERSCLGQVVYHHFE